jgi:hypothetical protein
LVANCMLLNNVRIKTYCDALPQVFIITGASSTRLFRT